MRTTWNRHSYVLQFLTIKKIYSKCKSRKNNSLHQSSTIILLKKKKKKCVKDDFSKNEFWSAVVLPLSIVVRRLWFRFPLGVMKYLIFSFPGSGNGAKRGVEFGRYNTPYPTNCPIFEISPVEQRNLTPRNKFIHPSDNRTNNCFVYSQPWYSRCSTTTRRLDSVKP